MLVQFAGMKTKKRYLTIGLLLLIVVQLLPGCWVVGRRDIFEYQRHDVQATGEFIPYLYIDKHALRASLLLVSFEAERLPHSLVHASVRPNVPYYGRRFCVIRFR